MIDDEVIDLIYDALRRSQGHKNLMINDVATERSESGSKQLILTTVDDEDRKQIWRIDSETITECDTGE
jgi:hypothetical protein